MTGIWYGDAFRNHFWFVQSISATVYTFVLDSARVVKPLCCLPGFSQKSPIFPQKSPIFLQKNTDLFWIALVWSSHCAVCQVFHKRALYSRKRALYSCKRTHWYVLDSARVVEPLCCLPDIPQKRPIFPQKRPIVARKGPYSRKRALTCSE